MTDPNPNVPASTENTPDSTAADDRPSLTPEELRAARDRKKAEKAAAKAAAKAKAAGGTATQGMAKDSAADGTIADGTTDSPVLEAARREKLRRIVELGIDPWGQRFDDRLEISVIRTMESQIGTKTIEDDAENSEPRREEHGPTVRAAGRIMLQRRAGKLIFLTIQDRSGRLQILLGKGQVGEADWELAQCLDLGDLVGFDGELRHTRTGELSIFATRLHFLGKSIETPPSKHEGLVDPELRQRMRYVDLIHTDSVLERFIRRTKIIRSIRRTLAGEGFIEVEGPTLHSVAGGAAARPFATYHNALDMPLTMRIALELHLKRLLVGGMERVYEIGRVYRNEGIDQKHNPEFTMLELYQAYGDYRSMMDLTEKMICGAIRDTYWAELSESEHHYRLPWGTDAAGDRVWLDFVPPFERKTYDELIAQHTRIDPTDAAAVVAYAKSIGIETDGIHPDVVKNELFEAKVEEHLTGPIFVYDYPASICPLTKRKADHPEIAERFELFIRGMELANAYTELNDPDLQAKLFTEQLAGQKEEDSMAKMDHDFVRALRYGMPPAGGLGIGIDRLVMLLTDTTSIRDVILFPLLRPE